MKKTLLMALMLIASAITAHAQGFRVYRSDGTVYQYSWVADRIEFYEGDGDPDWVEPIPESVQRALEELQTYVANNAACITRNTEDIQVLNYQYKALEDKTDMNETNIRELQDAIMAVQGNTARNSAMIEVLQNVANDNKESIRTLQDQSNALRTSITDNAVSIAQLNEKANRYEQDIRALQDQSQALQASVYEDKDNIAQLNGKVDRNEMDIKELQYRNEALEAHIAALQARLNELEEIVRQLAQ